MRWITFADWATREPRYWTMLLYSVSVNKKAIKQHGTIYGTLLSRAVISGCNYDLRFFREYLANQGWHVANLCEVGNVRLKPY